MPFRVSGKHIELGEALRERISVRVLEALEKYFDGGFSGHATVGKEAFGFHTECVVHLDSGIVLRADSMAADAYQSADQAAHNLEKRLRRYHRRLKDNHGSAHGNGRTRDEIPAIDAPSYVIAAPEHDNEDEGAGFIKSVAHVQRNGGEKRFVMLVSFKKIIGEGNAHVS